MTDTSSAFFGDVAGVVLTVGMVSFSLALVLSRRDSVLWILSDDTRTGTVVLVGISVVDTLRGTSTTGLGVVVVLGVVVDWRVPTKKATAGLTIMDML